VPKLLHKLHEGKFRRKLDLLLALGDLLVSLFCRSSYPRKKTLFIEYEAGLIRRNKIISGTQNSVKVKLRHEDV
jgi:hypothetical protein